MTGKKIKVIGFIFLPNIFLLCTCADYGAEIQPEKIVDCGSAEASPSRFRHGKCLLIPAPSPPEYRRRRGDNDLYDMTHGFYEPLT